MEKLPFKSPPTTNPKKPLPNYLPSYSPQRLCINSFIDQPLSPSQFKKQNPYRKDRFSVVKKFPESIKQPAKRNYDFMSTSKSLIVSTNETPQTQRQDFTRKYLTQSNKSGANHPNNFDLQNICTQKDKNPNYKDSFINKPSHFSLFLQLAKKEKDRQIPIYSLMCTPKSPKFMQKPQPFVIEELRQTEDTLPDFDRKYIPKRPKVSDFHQVKMLGKGKNGQVYLVVHKATGFACAMKIIKKADINKGTPQQRQILHNQLLRQIKLQLFLSHPNLVELYCVFSDKDNIYLIEELGIDGQLYDLMKKKHKFSQESTALIGRQILKGLKFMHEKQIIHRDIKPQNIVLVYGIAKLCDFGWSVYCPLEMRSTLCGTPLYLSPEVLIGDQYNEKIDIWAFGTLVFELFTGDNPFKIKNKSDLKKIVTEQLDFSHNFPRRLRAFLECILKKKSYQRPTATELQKHEFLKKYSQLQTSQQLANL